MDRNTLIGFALIAAIFIGFYTLNQPSDKERALYKQQQDSIAAAKQTAAVTHTSAVNAAKADTAQKSAGTDSTVTLAMKEKFGAFGANANGKEEVFTLENDLLKISLSSKGGRVSSVLLKKYKTSDGKPAILFDNDSSSFGFNFNAQNRQISTSDLFFTASGTHTPGALSLRLSIDNTKFIEYQYSVQPGSYMIDYHVKVAGLSDVIAANASVLSLNWKINSLKQEKTIEAERLATTIYYNTNDGVDYLSETSDDEEKITEDAKWVAFKQQYFTSVLIADKGFKDADLKTVTNKSSKKYVRELAATMNLPYTNRNEANYDMKFYFGPNHYKILKQFDLELEKQVPLGWGIFGWVNKFLVIPIFHFLSGFNMNYGIIILILTIIIKVLLLPLTYKAYLSQAKMKVLKPEIDEINASKEAADPMKKQQLIMGLYKKAGVNPLGGPAAGALPIRRRC